jgi:hypothetical protein
MKIFILHIARKLIAVSFLVIILSVMTYGQMQKFSEQNSNLTYRSSFLLATPNNKLIYFWYSRTFLYQSTSSDNGLNWFNDTELADSLADVDSLRDISCYVTLTGRILLTYKNVFYFLQYSDDNGNSWSSPTRLVTGTSVINARNTIAVNLSQSATGKIFLVYSKLLSGQQVQNVSYIASTDNGLTWSAQSAVLTGPAYGSVVPLGGSTLMLLYQNMGIFNSLSTDDGITWQNPVPVVSDSNISAPKAINDNSGKIWLFYVNKIATPFNNITQTDILYITSTNDGNDWSAVSHFTKFKGMDNYFSICKCADNPLVAFASNRFNGNDAQYNLWFGKAGITDDINTPPYVYQYNASNYNPPPKTSVKITLNIDDNYPISSVQMNRYLNGNAIAPVIMHDDGLLGDSIANDKVYSYLEPGLNMYDELYITFTLNNQVGQSITYLGPIISVPFDNNANTQLIDVNNFTLPINNAGVLADLVIDGAVAGGKLNNNIILFSGGFFLSGLTNGNMWANGIITASHIQDYLPGNVGSGYDDTKNIIYVLRSSDPEFGQSWQNWKTAVSMGADFFDGDHNGIYNPVDNNSNGKWDPDEDRPAAIGDITAWCVYNDAIPARSRMYSDVQPQGIEIQQTVSAKNTQGDLANVVFVRYRIINRGTNADVLDSVYFGAAADPDIGDNGAADLDGCDTLLNAGYTYHIASSTKFGSTNPALVIAGLQGPLSYIPGKTFIDNNSNGIYDDGIDTPLDTAYNLKGLAGINKYPGAKNLPVSSVFQYYNGIDPQNKFQARDYTLGLDNTGNKINPCTFTRGNVLGGVNCSNVNPLFMFSGDPLTQFGWINNTPEDQRLITNYGPFELKKNQPVDIVLAYVVGRGTSGLNSITVAKGISNSAKNYYKSNYDWGTTSVSDKNNILKSFSMDQNYPNPFNPNTKIKYNLPVDSHIKLTIYNTIGQVVKVLANDIQKSGSHEVNFNATSLSSGVYFYTLQSTSIDGRQNYSSTKKMILLK